MAIRLETCLKLIWESVEGDYIADGEMESGFPSVFISIHACYKQHIHSTRIYQDKISWTLSHFYAQENKKSSKLKVLSSEMDPAEIRLIR